MGELAFSGKLRPVFALLPAILQAHKSGRQCVVPADCQREAALVRKARPLLADHLVSVARFLVDVDVLPGPKFAIVESAGPSTPALEEVVGQHQAKRALERSSIQEGTAFNHALSYFFSCIERLFAVSNPNIELM